MSLLSVLNRKSWQHKSSKCATESTATLVSGDCITIRGWVVAARLAWSSSLVSASSWSESRFGSTATQPWTRDPTFCPSLNPPVKTTFCIGPKLARRSSLKDLQRNSERFPLFIGFEMIFPLLWTGVDPLWMFTSRDLDSPLLLRSPALLETERYWLKIRSTCV